MLMVALSSLASLRSRKATPDRTDDPRWDSEVYGITLSDRSRH